MDQSPDIKTPDVVIFGAGIAGLWTFHRLRKLGYDVLLLEKDSIGCGQTIAAQGIIHSGLKFLLAGKISALAKSISAMPECWMNALSGHGDIDLSQARINAQSQYLLIPAGFLGNLTTLIAQKTLGNNAHHIAQEHLPDDLKTSGFKGSAVFMDEPVLDIPSVIRALATPYLDSIKTITEKDSNAPFAFLEQQNIKPKRIIFTSAASNHNIAKLHNHDAGLETQKRPLVQAMIKNAPFPLFAHLVGKTDKPIASITTHTTTDGTLVWYLGGGIAECDKNTNPKNIYNAAIKALKKYMPKLDLTNVEWASLPIDRIEGKSKTDGWMPDTPTIHNTAEALYCWPTKLTFAPLLSDLVLSDLTKNNITPSNQNTDYSFLPQAGFTQTPWDKAIWIK